VGLSGITNGAAGGSLAANGLVHGIWRAVDASGRDVCCFWGVTPPFGRNDLSLVWDEQQKHRWLPTMMARRSTDRSFGLDGAACGSRHQLE